MKSYFNLAIAILAASSCAAQFTLDDFPREASFTDTGVTSTSELDLPEHGDNVLWDFSSLSNDGSFSVTYNAANNDADFPEAINYRQRNLSFQGLEIESTEYDVLNSDAYSTIGRKLVDVTYSITAMTGGANDELRFVGGAYSYGNGFDYVKFPMEYGDSWSMDYNEITDYELTVAAFGLNETPGQLVRYLTQSREVVGRGSFIIPDENGEPSLPIAGYLLRAVRSAVDSVFLGGDLAPQPLLDAFGLTQGAYAADSFYIAYANGLGTPLLGMNIAPGMTFNYSYRPQAAELGSSVSEFARSSIQVYPNPVVPGQLLHIQAAIDETVATAQIYSITGQRVHDELLNRDLKMGTAFAVPQHLNAGMYFMHLINNRGETVGQTKFMVK